ncbi:MAG: DUF2231 domain-containing protein [Beutenbergiaceae bacterium]
MFDQFLGLPMHILVLHAVVVLGPLAALCAIAYVLRPAWRWYLKWPTLALAVVTGVAGFVTGQSGEALQQQMLANGLSGELLQMVEAHAQVGKASAIIGIIFMLVTVAIVWWALPASHRAGNTPTRPTSPLTVVAGGIEILLALGLITIIAITGHLGASAAWSGVF